MASTKGKHGIKVDSMSVIVQYEGDDVETRSPTDNEWESGQSWLLTHYAYSSNNQYASYGVTSAEGVHRWKSYGFNIPSGNVVTSVKVQIEHYETSLGDILDVAVSWDGGTSWGPYHAIDGRLTEGTDIVDVTSETAWTPDKLSNANLKTKLRALAFPTGCYHPEGEVCVFAPASLHTPIFEHPPLIKIKDVKVGDVLLGWNKKRNAFAPAKVKKVTFHEEEFTFYRIICRHRNEFWDKSFMSYEDSQKVESFKDICVTGNHPCVVAPFQTTKLAQDIKVGDRLYGLVILRGCLVTIPCIIIKIETFKSVGCVNIETDADFLFSHYMLGKIIK